MASNGFNPQIDDTGVSNFAGRSQGTGANRTFEAIFGGLTNTLKNVTEVKDQDTQKAIQDDATKVFDQTNSEFGLQPDSGSEVDPLNLPVGGSTNAPSQMQSELDRVASLHTALTQGKISEVNYYGRLATLSKQLRAKYPRYEEIVDKTIQSVTGTRPANAYRDAIFSEIQSLSASASSDEKFKRQYEKENEGVISLLIPDYFTNSGKYDFAKVQNQVASFKAKKESIEAQTNQLGLLAKQGEVNDKTAAKVISQDFNFITQTAMQTATGQGTSGFQAVIDDFVKSGKGPQDVDAFAQQMAVTENQLRTSLMKRGSEKYAGIMTQDDINKAVDAAMYPITQAKAAVLGGDYKYASRYATIGKISEDQQVAGMMEKSPEFRVGKGLSAVSQAAADNYINSLPTDQLTTVGLEIAGQSMAGNTTLLKDVVEGGSPKAARSAIDQTLGMIVGGDVKGKDLSNTVQTMFGPQATDWMSPKVISSDDIAGVYMKFLDPRVTAQIKKNGTPEDLRLYTAWAMEKFASIPAFRAAAGDIGDVLPSGVDVQYDPNTSRLVLKGDPTWSMVRKTNAQKAINTLNQAFSVLQPIVEANGEDGQKVIPELVKQLNVTMEGSKDGGFWGGVYDAIQKAGVDLGKPIKKSSDQGSLAPDLSGVFDGVIDFANEMVKPIPAAPKDQTPVEDLSPRQINTRLAPFLTGATDGSSLSFTHEFGSNLERFLRDAPDQGIRIFSGYRSPAHQKELFDAAVKKYGSVEAARKWVAPPGRSNHNKGGAADLRFASPEIKKWAHDHADEYGLHFRMGNEPWHIELKHS